MTDDHHPCQALADCLTLREHFGSLDGLTLAYVGDGNNVAHSLIEAAHLTGMNLRLATPPGCLPDPSILAAAGRSSPDAVARHAGRGRAGADAVYYRIRRARWRRRVTTPSSCTAGRRTAAKRVDSDVIDGPASLVWAQAANRLPTAQALLSALVTGDWEV